MTDITILGLCLVAMGPFVGSFLNVLIDRLPRGEDVVVQRSACRSCGQVLGPLDLVPLWSFAWRRGRCGSCGAPIPAWHLYVEIAAPGLALIAVLAGGSPWVMVLQAVMLWLLLALMVSDLIWFRLPDVLTGSLLAVGLILATLDPGRSLADAALGAGLGATVFWLVRAAYWRIRHREGLGLGDVKLLAALGAVLGVMALPLLLLVASLLGLLLALVLSAVHGMALSTQMRVPFGTALCLAAMLLWLLAGGQYDLASRMGLG